ncbi:NAD-dependent epimerase/dehydratase family protein [Lysobacter sp. GX 14042]|uniref:NAD-dependent epimerase/dehydratase family protein n=1 Tax=Lysobacter sp. GX 14042 TaxID=2907155 RepID=UPI001F1B0A5E|nr:NAD-dependent epimerase/dehydratase family protein [Lysobacter sp. GX 14042]MCE7032787.1 NAD-dependent epimerase/dehydratase family protein [Lysobacter sp. GX 14042]
MNILITGAAGFVGFHSAKRLLSRGHRIVGVDNLNSYYDVRLKHERLTHLRGNTRFEFHELNLADRDGMRELFRTNSFDVVLHLGAQAGVRYSIEQPFAYIDSNVVGMLSVLEGCRHSGVKHLVYASSSSVYGANTKQPFSIEDRTDDPVSLYAATKKSDELMCRTYAHLYRLPSTGLRFFTVYGPFGRPDMAYYKFADAITAGRAIDVYNHGNMKRDFTYVDDIVDCIEVIVEREPSSSKDATPHRVYNLGNNRPERVLTLVGLLEEHLGVSARVNLLPMQPGDVEATYADIEATRRDFGFAPKVSLSVGIQKFAEWYLARRDGLAASR